MRPLVVIPTYEEAATIRQLLESIGASLPAAHVLVVDDGGGDATADIVAATADESGHVSLVRRPRKLGLGSAYRTGFRWGIEHDFDVLVEMDGDLSHDPAALPALLGALEGADLVIGSRYVPGGSIPRWNAVRRALSRWGNRYAATMLALGITDATSGYRAWRASILDAIAIDDVGAEGYAFQIETAYRTRRAGGRIVEVPIRFVERSDGSSKMSTAIIAEALLLVTAWGVRDRLRGWARRRRASA